jgi:hypothetical protein
MADTHTSAPAQGPTTAEGFLADRMSFWHSVTGMTTKTAAALIVFCAWLWWCTFAGFSIFHVVLLPIAVAAVVRFL